MSHACAMRLLRSFGGLLGCSLLDMIYISPSIWVWSICSPILLSISVSLFGACVVTTSPKLQQKNNSRLKRKMCSYLTSFFLPEDRRLWVSFRLTWETGRPSLRHNLIPRSDHELWCSWVKNQRHEHYTIPSDTQMHMTHTHADHWQSVGNVKHPQALTAKVTETELPCISPFLTAFGLLVYLFALTTNRKDSNSNHRKPFIQVSPQMAVLNEWRGAFRHGSAAITTPEGRVGHSGQDTRRGEAMWGHHTLNLDTSFVSGFKYSTLFTLRTQSIFYFCIEDKQSSQAGQAWKTSNWLLAF